MKREIKFRIWNGMEMVYDITAGKFGTFYVNPEKGDGLNPQDTASLSANTTIYQDSVPLMQFTGPKDKEGKELYSGDIFKDEKGTIYRCYTVTGGFACSLPQFPNTLKEETAWPLQPLADEQTVSWFESNCTIIGNIFENPELLNS